MKKQKLYLILLVSIVSITLVISSVSYYYLTKIEQKYIQKSKHKDKLISKQIVILQSNLISKIKNIENKTLLKVKQLQAKSQSKNLKIDELKNAINNNYIQQEKFKKELNENIKKRISIYIDERKKDILFLSRIKLRQKIINSFFFTAKIKNKFIYKEVSFFNLKGEEIYKKSRIEALKMNIFKKANTYCHKENYKKQIFNLKEGEIFISKPISCKNNKTIIRLITPIIRKFKHVGFLEVAIDYTYINRLKNYNFLKK
jgi:hypothetical protein